MNLRTQAEVRIEALEKQVDFLTGMMLSLLVTADPAADLEEFMVAMEKIGFDEPRGMLAVVRENYQANVTAMLGGKKAQSEEEQG